jgi:hypothetical protein
MAGGIDMVGIISMFVTVIYAVGSYILACYLGRKLAKVEKWVLTWLIFDALIHFTLVSGENRRRTSVSFTNLLCRLCHCQCREMHENVQ